MQDMPTIPVTIVTGALGAGKTTLLNRLLAGKDGRKNAVIVNEFGEIGIDVDLIRRDDEDLIELVNGCICCQAGDSFASAVRGLLAKAPFLEGIFVETSGLSDPLPVARTILEDYVVASACRLQSIVTVVDASCVHRRSMSAAENNQIALGDQIILSKTDLLSPDELDKAKSWARRRNEAADISAPGKLDAVPVPLLRASRARSLMTASLMDQPAGTHDAISSASLTIPGDVDAERFFGWVGPLIRGAEMDIMRSKGVIAMAGDRRRFVFQSVQSVIDGAPDLEWRAGESRTSRMVFIGRRLQVDRIAAEFNQCAA